MSVGTCGKHPPLLREDVSIHPESPRILRSTLENYGVWKAHPKRYDVERGGTRTPHLTLYFGNNEGIDFRAAINIKSGDQPESRLVYWVNEDMKRPSARQGSVGAQDRLRALGR